MCTPPSQCSALLFWLSQVRSFKSDFDAVKTKVGVLNEYIKTSYSVPSPLTVLVPPLQCLFPLLAISVVSSWILML